MSQPCIYLLKNNANGKVYVGKTSNPKVRFELHMAALRSNRHNNFSLQEDFNKYGESQFSFELEIENLWKYDGNYCQAEPDTMIKYRSWDEKYGYNNNDRLFWLQNGVPTKRTKELLGI